MTRNVADEVARRREAALAGHRGDEVVARRLLADSDAGVRASALGALARMGAITETDLAAALTDAAPVVRRRACEEAIPFAVDLGERLADEDAAVVEAACWALGERGETARSSVAALAAVATDRGDPLC